MRWLTRILRRGNEVERDIDDELRFHIETRAERYIRAGMTPEEARRRALEQFGNFDEIREAVREIDFGAIESIWQDVCYAARTLRKSPNFTATAVLSLALGIGLNSAIFSAINAVLLRPLPYREPERLVSFASTFPSYRNGAAPAGLSPANYLDFEEQNHVFEGTAWVNPFFAFYGEVPLVTDETTERIRAVQVSRNFFRLLGVQPALGRVFLPEEHEPGASAVVLGHDLWRGRFGADPNVLGRDITLERTTYRVIGVMPEGYRYYSPAGANVTDAWLPITGEKDGIKDRSRRGVRAIARLKPGVTVDQARAELQLIAQRLARAHPTENKGMGAWVSPLLEGYEGNSRSILLPLWAAVGLVLLIACANVATLLVARSGEREREIAIRAAIGARRTRLLRQLLTESALLALAGGVAGLTLALSSADFLKYILPNGLFRLDETSVDGGVLAFTLVVSSATSVLFGLAPALTATRVDLNHALKDAVRTASERKGRARLRGALVTGQVALSLVLLAGAGLMINSVWRLYHIDPGFEPDGLLTVRCILPKLPSHVAAVQPAPHRVLTGPGPHWALTAEGMDFPRQVIERLEQVPGVEAAAASVYGLPMTGRSIADGFRVEGQPAALPGQEGKIWACWRRGVSPHYFRAMGIKLIQGRWFDDRDTQNAPGAAIINQTLARAIWPDEANVIGKRIILDSLRRTFEIVGVLEDVRSIGWERQGPREMYIPLSQEWRPSYDDSSITLRLELWFVVRSQKDPASLAAAVRNAFREVDRSQPADQFRPYSEVISELFRPWRSTMLLLGLFAGTAVLLSAIGIYGVTSNAVIQRSHEIGVRTALGAGPSQVVRLLMRNVLLLALGGLTLGSVGAYGLTRFIATQLYGVTPTDPATFATVALALLAVALLACYLPARRAARLDPVAALRCE